MGQPKTPDSNLIDIKNDVISWYESYARAWREGKTDVEHSLQCYAFPNYFALPDGVRFFPDAEAERSFLVGFISELKSKDWVGTRLSSLEVKMINTCAAFIEAEMTHETADGCPVEGYDVTVYSYLAGKTPQGWRFLSGHSS